jgi:hypothetical protein
MPESALTAPKEKRLTGRQYFESGRHIVVLYPTEDVCHCLCFSLSGNILSDIPHLLLSYFIIELTLHELSYQKGASTVAEEDDEEEEEDIEFDEDFEGKLPITFLWTSDSEINLTNLAS